MADVSGIIDRLTPLVEETLIKEYNLWINSKTEATKLYFNLKEVEKVLEEAERRRLADPRVKAWLENLHDVVYEIDDVLDEWETLDRQLEILQSDEENASRTWWERIGACIESICLRPGQVCQHRDIAKKIKTLNEKVDALGNKTGKYALLPIINDSQDVEYEITTSFGDHVEIPYQQHVKEELVKKLLAQGVEPGNIKFVSLVGMVGVGKTTIAQLVFKHIDKVQSEFELKSWVCVSHISDVVHLTEAIHQSFPETDADLQRLLELINSSVSPKDAQLQRHLELIKSSVSGKKFFLVLDHVRIEDESVWNQLKDSLSSGARGSIVLVTSRNEYPWKLICPGMCKEVKILPEKDCLSLFRGIALRGRTLNEEEKLGDTVEQIAEKCEGLPLAAKTLGYYMQSRFSKKLWDDVAEKEVWQLDEVAKALFAPLTVTYNELPLALKHCFLYCALLPKKVMINMDELTRLWMVQGYVETEVRGWDYFEKFGRNSFFQDIKKDDSLQNFQNCELHPILHDFALYLTNARSENEKRRSFWPGDWPPRQGSLNSVRVLKTREGIKDVEVPLDIGHCIHLRYLDLSKNRITRLPETICNLCNLKTLNVRQCEQLSYLPVNIHRLRNLRHLLMGGSGLRGLPERLKKLTDLVALDEIYVGEMENEFRYLANFNQLRGYLVINIGNLNEPEDAREADLGRKNYLSELWLKFRQAPPNHGTGIAAATEAPQAPPNHGKGIAAGTEAPPVPQNHGKGIAPPNHGKGIAAGTEAPRAPPNHGKGIRPPNHGKGIAAGTEAPPAPPNHGKGIAAGTEAPPAPPNHGKGIAAGTEAPQAPQNHGKGIAPPNHGKGIAAGTEAPPAPPNHGKGIAAGTEAPPAPPNHGKGIAPPNHGKGIAPPTEVPQNHGKGIAPPNHGKGIAAGTEAPRAPPNHGKGIRPPTEAPFAPPNHGKGIAAGTEAPRAPPNHGKGIAAVTEAQQAPPNHGKGIAAVMEALQAPPNLRSFVIEGYNGTEFPSWISTSLNKIITLGISECSQCEGLPPIGQMPLLRLLKVSGMSSLRRVGCEFLGIPSDGEICPKLRFLEFEDCESWEEWEDISTEANPRTKIMPRLERVSIKKCSKLKGLPDLLLQRATSFKTLAIDFGSCPQLLERYGPNSPGRKLIFQNGQSSASTSK